MQPADNGSNLNTWRNDREETHSLETSFPETLGVQDATTGTGHRRYLGETQGHPIMANADLTSSGTPTNVST